MAPEISRYKSRHLNNNNIYNLISRLIGFLTITLGTFVLLSWFFDIEVGQHIQPMLPSMKFNTAFCFIACGFLLIRSDKFKTLSLFNPLPLLFISIILLVPSFTLFEYWFSWQLGIDNFFVEDQATPADQWPGRMSEATAICFVLVAAAQIFISTRLHSFILISQLLSFAVVIISGAALVAYIFGAHQFKLPIFSTMAVHTSLLFVLIGIAMLFIRPYEGFMIPATSTFIGGHSFRHLFPFIIVTPVLIGWLSLKGLEASYYTEEFGFAITSMLSILILSSIGWLSAKALNREERHFRSAIDSSPVATVMVDEAGIIHMANRLAHSMFHYVDGQLVGQHLDALIPDRFHSKHKGYRHQYMKHPEKRMMGEGRDLFAVRQDGTEFPAEIALNPVQIGKSRYVMAAIINITERLEAAQKILRLNRIYKVLSGINTLIVRVQTHDALCEEATRITVEDGELPAALVVQRNRESEQYTIMHVHAQNKTLEKRELSDFEKDTVFECLQNQSVVLRNDLTEHNANGDLTSLIDVGIHALVALPLTLSEHSIEAAFILYRHERFSFDQPEMELLKEVAGDISFAFANLEKSKQLEYLTHFDNITGMPNRLLLTDRLQQAILQADAYQGIVSILYIDIDRFKQINDSLGHSSGDDVLRQVAQRVESCVGKSCTVSRWSGDEFIVLLPGQDTESVSGVADCINDSLHALMVLEDKQELFVSCSIGIAEYPLNGMNIDALINSARTAMTSIKEHGGNDYKYFVKGNEPLDDVLTLETSLRHALSQAQFQLHYQPQIDIVSGRLVGFEALLRWHHPEQGMIAPDRFIPMAEKTGLIIPIGEWVIREACEKGAKLQNVKIAVNLSARQFHQDNLVESIQKILEETGMTPEYLELEITESALIHSVESAIIKMEQLIHLGTTISLDDFGTGYSSLSYLKRFPIDMLKIDKSFIDELTTDPESEVIVKTIIVMAHSLGLKVIAEGVETQEQLSMLGERGCDQAQGYLIARPLPFQQAIEAVNH